MNNDNIIGKIIITVMISMLTLLIVCVVRSSYYDDEWIVGKSEKRIVIRYGEFDTIASYPNINRCFPEYDSTWSYGRGYMTRNLGSIKYYYAIFFDENGRALFVEENWAYPGG